MLWLWLHVQEPCKNMLMYLFYLDPWKPVLRYIIWYHWLSNTQQSGPCVPEPIGEDGAVHFCKDVATMVWERSVFHYIWILEKSQTDWKSDPRDLWSFEKLITLLMIDNNPNTHSNPPQLRVTAFTFQIVRRAWQKHAPVPTIAAALWCTIWKREFRFINSFRFNHSHQSMNSVQ